MTSVAICPTTKYTAVIAILKRMEMVLIPNIIHSHPTNFYTAVIISKSTAIGPNQFSYIIVPMRHIGIHSMASPVLPIIRQLKSEIYSPCSSA